MLLIETYRLRGLSNYTLSIQGPSTSVCICIVHVHVQRISTVEHRTSYNVRGDLVRRNHNPQIFLWFAMYADEGALAAAK